MTEDRFSNLAPLQRAYLAIEQLQSRLDTLERQRSEPIAIVGIGCRFPGGADSPALMWDLLRGGVDAVTEVPRERWNVDEYYDPDPSRPGKMCTRWGGFLDGVDRFDAPFFNISPREAALMDPQQRLLLEVTWEALEDAGQSLPRLSGSRTGVFVGIYNNDYLQFQHQDDVYAALGNSLGIAPGRLSYTFDLQGPSLLVDTLCSSSLVAVSLACHSLRGRECDLALAGGVNLILSPVGTIMASRLFALAPDGRCKTFDSRANGFVRSEGCGVVVLKRLSDALADGDPIWALIRGAAVNQDGRSTALTAPNVLAQQAVMRQALADGGVAPEQVSFIEAHGTGTALGDPIEVEALRAVYGKVRARGDCAIGSIKTNLGHAEAAAGIAGLIKAVLALKHEMIPPHLHLRDVNPRIEFRGTPFVIPTEPRPWPGTDGERRLAAVSSFGLGGTNAHVILEEAPALQGPGAEEEAAEDNVQLLPLSARTPAALAALVHDYRALLSGPGVAVHDLCYTASTRRTHHDVRLAVVGRSAGELRDGLDAAIGRAGKSRRRGKVAFVFSGHGGQYAGMGRELAQTEPAFRRALDACERAIRPHAGWSLLTMLEDPDATWLQTISRVQPAVFAIQVALYELWRSWGLRPQAVAGHSMGEVAAAYAAGALSLDDAARVICCRSQLLETMRGRGGTAVVELSLDEARRAINGRRLSVAGSNGPRTTLVGGDGDAVAAFVEDMAQRQVLCRRVSADVPFHTELTAPLGPAALARLDGLTAVAGHVPFYSGVTGRLYSTDQCGPAYWAENLVRPVQLWPAVQRMIDDGCRLFLEIAPHSLLTPALGDGLRALEVEGEVRPSLRRGESERRVMLEALGAAYEDGHAVAWSTLYGSGRPVTLPTYPFQRESYWVDAAAGMPWTVPPPANGPERGHPLLGEAREVSAEPGTTVWEFELDVRRVPFLADHRVEGTIVVPAALFIESALAGAAAALGEGWRAITKLELRHVLALRDDERRAVQLVIRRRHPAAAEFQFASRPRGTAVEWTIHAQGWLSAAAEAPPEEETRRDVEDRCTERLPIAALYEGLAAAGLEYGPAFQTVTDIWRCDGEVLARLELPATVAGGEPYSMHPALLDGCFQAFAAAVPREIAEQGGLFLPVGAARIEHHRASPGQLWAHARLRSTGEALRRIEGDVFVRGEEGALVAHVRQFALQRLAPDAASDELTRQLYVMAWRARVRPTRAAASPGTTILLAPAGPSDALERLRDALAARGGACEIGSPETLQARLQQARSGSDVPRRVVYMAGILRGETDAAAAAEGECAGLLHVAQTLALAGLRDAPRLWVVTRGVHAIGNDVDDGGLSQSALWGMARTIALEHSEFSCGRVDLSPVPADDEAADLAAELCDGDDEDQIALRPAGRYVARLVPRGATEQPPPLRTPAGDRQFTLQIQTPGILDTLVLRASPRRPPGPGEIEIEVQAAGLNFLDVLSVMGLRPGGDGAPLLVGSECAGTVTAVGAGVESLREGDSVVAIAASSFSRFAVTRAEFAVPIPRHLSCSEAATIPVAFMTAYYALHELGRMQRGERVLIHSASGGTGLAAVQLAQRAGLEIFATAGNPQKRELLRALGVPHVMDSRTLDFADEVMAKTGGRGVDLVLNSLTGEAIERSLAVVAPDGRFLEIGKKDIYQGYRMGLLPFRGALSYFAVDLAGLALRRPAVVSALLQTIIGLVEAGELRPLPLRTFPIADAERAFHTMAQAAHTGKLVLTIDDAAATPVESAPAGASALESDGTYLITGGLGALGLAVAAWLVEQGARQLVLVGRREPAAAAVQAIETLRDRGARVEVLQADVAQRAVVADLLARVDDRLPPLRGIVHAAAVLEDATVMRLQAPQLGTVFAPKVRGAWNLHTLTAGRPLDFFVLFSSAASVLGAPGQANYAAANAFLDALAHHRRACGQTAVSINWGPWAEIGLAAAQDNRGQRLAAMGIGSLPPQQALAALGRVLGEAAPQVAVMDFRLRTWRQLAPAAAGLRLFDELLDGAAVGQKRAAPSKLRGELIAADVRVRRSLLEEHLAGQIAQVLRMPAAKVTRETPFNTLGIDSLMGLELRNRLESTLGVTLPATLVWSHPTIATLVPHLAATLGVALDEDSFAPASSEAELADDDLSDDEASALLAERLAALDDEYLS